MFDLPVPDPWAVCPTLAIFQAEGAFVCEFVDPQATHRDEARARPGHVRHEPGQELREGARHHVARRTWEPKKSFRAVADFYASH